ncbi:MAG: diguanylate cyclase [Hydrogenophilus sp.]|nr:diguanylate cyclase [Hydrogenophilus sp.]
MWVVRGVGSISKNEGYRRIHRRTWGAFVLAHMLVVALLSIVIQRDRQLIEAQVMRQTAEAARLLKEKVDDIFATVDGSLKLIVAEIRPEDLQENVLPSRQEEIVSLLRRHKEGFKPIANIGITDASGLALYVAEGKAGFRVDDRRYYHFLRNTPSAEISLSEFIRIRSGSNDPAILLARRIRTPETPFLGLALTPVKLAFFEEIIEKLELGVEGVAALYTHDLVMLGRRPAVPDNLGKPLPDREHILKLIGDSDKGSFKLVSPLDHIPRLFSFHRTELGLITVIGRSETDYLAPWRAHIYWLAGAYLALFVFSFVLVRRWLAARAAELNAIETALNESERNRQFRTLVESLGYPLIVIDKTDFRVLHANEDTPRSLGIDKEDLLGRSIEVLLGEDAREKLERTLQAQNLEVHLRRPDGSTFWGLISVTPVEFQGQEALMVGIINIDERKAREDELAFKAHYDPLTFAYSRGYFLERLEAVFQHARKHGRTLAAIAFDLDRFKSVNDLYGHAAGDTVLKDAVAAAKSVLRDADLLGRTGGEEFVVVTHTESLNTACQIAERLRAAIAAQRIEIGSSAPLQVTASFGVALLSPEETLEAWLKRADAALYQAKRSGRNCVCTG